ncbi:FeoA family protein [Desulfovibrio inopinatus]|uniref:FeoA family protein n=1 Tax=Desulfovibrio inopinatus TaxID=102109 RepID=UPI00041F7A85|nr:FeoA family protein [Desulfovibrio inopinatus]
MLKKNFLCEEKTLLESIQLSRLPQLCQALVVSVGCSSDITCRLASLGLLPDKPVFVIRTTKRGAVVIRTNGMLLALSAGVAQKIFVKDAQHETE